MHDDRAYHKVVLLPQKSDERILIYYPYQILDVKCLYQIHRCEVVAGAGLQCLAIVHQGLDRVGCLCTGKFLLLVGLASADNRNCQEVLAHRSAACHLTSSRYAPVLPQRLHGAVWPPSPPRTLWNAGTDGGLFPTYNRSPLVVVSRQIARMYVMRKIANRVSKSDVHGFLSCNGSKPLLYLSPTLLPVQNLLRDLSFSRRLSGINIGRYVLTPLPKAPSSSLRSPRSHIHAGLITQPYTGVIRKPALRRCPYSISEIFIHRCGWLQHFHVISPIKHY